jgi:hypothetical protein
VTVPLIARSNSPYRLLVKSVTTQDSANPLQVILRSIDPSAGTRHLMPDATAVRAGGQLAVANGETTIAEGPRISNGGNDATIDNAIRLSVEIEFPQHVSEADLIFTMEFPAN